MEKNKDKIFEKYNSGLISKIVKAEKYEGMVPYFMKWKCSNQWTNAQRRGSRICRRIEH